MEVIQQQNFAIGHQCQGCNSEQQFQEKAALMLSVSVTSYVSFLLAESQRLSGVLRDIESTLGDLLTGNEAKIEGEDEKPSLSSKVSSSSNAEKRAHISKVKAERTTKNTENAPAISQDSQTDAEINELAKRLISLLEKEKSQVRKRDHDIPFPLF